MTIMWIDYWVGHRIRGEIAMNPIHELENSRKKDKHIWTDRTTKPKYKDRASRK